MMTRHVDVEGLPVNYYNHHWAATAATATTATANAHGH